MFQETMGMSQNFPLILGGCIECTYLVDSAIPGLCLCFVMVTILLSTGTRGRAYGATALIFLFQLFYGIGWLPVPWFYPSEIKTIRIHTRMQAIASGWNWMAVFSVVKITPIAFDNIGWRTFVIFAVLNAAFIPMIYFFYPETKGLELEEIPLLFHKGGFTGGVYSSKGGRTTVPHQHAQDHHIDSKAEYDTQQVEVVP